ncbi:MAG: hypothetical protein DI619_05220, partial [Francisella sp.]
MHRTGAGDGEGTPALELGRALVGLRTGPGPILGQMTRTALGDLLTGEGLRVRRRRPSRSSTQGEGGVRTEIDGLTGTRGAREGVADVLGKFGVGTDCCAADGQALGDTGEGVGHRDCSLPVRVRGGLAHGDVLLIGIAGEPDVRGQAIGTGLEELAGLAVGHTHDAVLVVDQGIVVHIAGVGLEYGAAAGGHGDSTGEGHRSIGPTVGAHHGAAAAVELHGEVTGDVGASIRVDDGTGET